MHVRGLDFPDSSNEGVQSSCHLRGRLASLAAVMPDVPWALCVQALVLPASSDLRGEEALVRAVLPLADVVCGLDLVGGFEGGAVRGGEEEAVGALGARARRDVDACEFRGRDQP